MWKLLDEANGKSKAENAEKMKELLEGMPPLIPELESVEVGVQMFGVENDAQCDILLIAECKNEANLRAYAVHPEHQKVVSFIKSVVSERRVIDYETE
ncbi:MAG: Dabb family protein [Balneolales bacterium]|nr:Dabb family protein [Balneolales bacterium]